MSNMVNWFADIIINQPIEGGYYFDNLSELSLKSESGRQYVYTDTNISSNVYESNKILFIDLCKEIGIKVINISYIE